MASFEMTTEQLSALRELCERYAVRRLMLFGSAATGGFDPQNSDLDFVAEFDRPTGMSLSKQFFGFMVELEDLFGREVDLLELPAIENPYLREEIDETAVTVYAA